MKLSVLSVASEAAPLIKTGGLADVVGALPAAVAPHRIAMTTLLPGYPGVMQALSKPKTLHSYIDLLGEPARLVDGKLDGHPFIALDAPNFFARDGAPYTDASGQDWPDNWRRFAALGRAAADLAGGLVKGRRFDVLHAHDWQAAMAPAYLRYASGAVGPVVPTVMTIHNMAFQGRFPAAIFPMLGMPQNAWGIDGVEYFGGVGYLKAGMQAASAITTVSPTYAAEIHAPEFGMGLDGLIRERSETSVFGILNGIDTASWNPASDPALAVKFDAASLDKRAANKSALEKEFELEPDAGDVGSPLFVVISRLTWQKGMDVLVAAIDHLVASGARLAVLGSGDRDLEAAFRAAAARHPGRVGVRIGYDEALSHLMQGGGDAILITSRFEPCGLTQLYGLAYGCVPVVARTGGLADTVIDANVAAIQAGVATGIQFDGVTQTSVEYAINRVVALYRQKHKWSCLQANGMASDFSWNSSGKTYAELYRSLVTQSRGGAE